MKGMKRSHRHIPALAALILLTGTHPLNGQTPYREEITVVAPYQPVISDAFKINQSPEPEDSVVVKKTFQYSILSKTLPTPFSPEPLKPARLAGEPLDKLYRNYLRAGMGNYRTPMLEYYYNSLRSKELNYGLKLNHLSSAGEIDGYGFPGTSRNMLGFHLHRIGRKGNTLASEVSYQRDVVHFYGFPLEGTAVEPERDDYRQRYSDVGARVRWYRHARDPRKLQHDMALSVSHLSDLDKNSELNMNIEGEIEKEIDAFDLFDKHAISLGAGADIFHNRGMDSSLGTAAIIHLEPVFRASIREFDILLGLRAEAAADSSASLSLAPLAEVRIHVLESALSIFFGTDGKIERNSYRWYRDQNPYLSTQLPLNFRETKYRFYGGLEGRLGQRFSFNTTLAASRLENVPFFLTDTTWAPFSRFTVVQDESSLFDVRATLVYQHRKKWQSRALLVFQQHSLSSGTPWHVPELYGSLAMEYNLREKFNIEAEVLAMGKRKALKYQNGTMDEVTLKGYADISLGVEYRYSRILSAFVQANNILGIKYEEWANYPQQGLKIMGGLTYSF